jgi:uncharacterized protein (DUF1778 family)
MKEKTAKTTIGVRVSEETKQILKDFAHEQKTTLSELILRNIQRNLSASQIVEIK